MKQKYTDAERIRVIDDPGLWKYELTLVILVVGFLGLSAWAVWEVWKI